MGYISSPDGGDHWGDAVQLAGPMSLTDIADTSQGRMVGDYISTSFNASGQSRGYFVVANPPTSGGTDCQTATPNCDVSLNTFVNGQ